eukprot:TRINITY_DN2080_c1_g1_i5.p2 TRINITY_DN2080_c1_g1~~TRINITY_DN2080_c1_g1_i5.p2  ORF type:complete len:102 (+),score=15.49 TRINITY_DN2080_c1_g1_i5:2446-2751(+)
MSLTAIKFPSKLKRLHYQEKCLETLGQVRSSPSKFSSRHIDCKGYPIRRCTFKGAFVDIRNVTLPHQRQKLYGAASYYKQAKLLQASDLGKTKQKLQDLSK